MTPLEVALCALDAARPALARPLAGKPPRPADVSEKAAHDYLTELDLAVERAVAGVVLDAFPAHAVAGEELFRAPDGSPDVWYLDPIDGTRNLVAGRPEVAVSLAWYHRGEPRVAAMWLPCRDLVVACDSEAPGILVNGAPYVPPPAPPPERGLAGLAGDMRGPEDPETFTGLFGALARRFEGIRLAGALGYDLACMALGELDARVSLHAKPVDVAAGALLVRHAGGVVSGVGGAFDVRAPGILAARSEALHRTLAAAVQEGSRVR